MTPRMPQQGGRANGGPFAGRVLAYDKTMLPIRDNTGKEIGYYFWTGEIWEYEDEDDRTIEVYP